MSHIFDRKVKRLSTVMEIRIFNRNTILITETTIRYILFSYIRSICENIMILTLNLGFTGKMRHDPPSCLVRHITMTIMVPIGIGKHWRMRQFFPVNFIEK